MRGKVGVSMRAYARSRRARGLPGGSLQAVQRALRAGRIHALPSGRIEPVRADREWAALTVERVSIYRPGTRRLKSEQGDRPAAKAEKSAARRQGEEKSTRRAGAWEPSEAQVRRWSKCREQLKWIDCRLACASTSSQVPDVRTPGPGWLYQRGTPDWAHQEPRVYALEMANDLVSAALIELSRAIGYPGYKCPEEK